MANTKVSKPASPARKGTTPSGVGVVLGGDNRARVATSTNTPSRWIGQIESRWPDDSITIGTGTLIDDHHVLTCAHNFYDTKKEVSCTAAAFTPALNRNSAGNLQSPYNSYELRGWSVPDLYKKTGGPPPPPAGVAWTEVTNYLYDYAVGTLTKAVSDPPGESLLSPSWPGDDQISTLACTINGYSGDLDHTANTQYTRSGGVALDNSHEFVMYTMSTYHGDSGAPVFFQPPQRNYWTIIAIHVTGVPDSAPGAGDGRNFGPAMTSAALEWVQGALAGVSRLGAIRP